MTLKCFKTPLILLLCIGFITAHVDICKSPPTSMDTSQCCKTPEFIDPKIIEKCLNKYGDIHNQCIMFECIFIEMKLVDGSGAIDSVAWKELIKKNTPETDKEWLPVMEPLVDECIKRADESANKKVHVPIEGEQQCNSRFNSAAICIMDEAFLNCPASIFKSAKECHEMREFIRNCFIK